ncbi:chondroitin sulfate N-acetylgalactosaminyltransferase 1-like [Xenia sp. Carnegie-2017]|uniref:chondroitin sulfate N-acetylgalactosaminyltransferase 1-like n=1 Tax=Xenia sp. Carnegie-2017 TaxID=2897299 RepID=UPI001F048027|nr:chondroitin sulfate N-acetylgalactosaminyltransferase 1-like [Xenia sp. Carnegie-2017]
MWKFRSSHFTVCMFVVGLIVALVQILMMLNRAYYKIHTLTEEKNALTSRLRTLQALDYAKEANQSKPLSTTMFPRLNKWHANKYFDATPYDSFTHQKVFSVNKDGIYFHPSRVIGGERSEEHKEVLLSAVDLVNKKLITHKKSERVSSVHLVNGISKLDRANGMEYDLIFKIGNTDQYERVKVYRPYKDMEFGQSIESFSTLKQRVNVIIPLSGRQREFKLFLKHFGECCLQRNVYLTVVYFGDDGKQDVNSSLKEFERQKQFHNYDLIFAKGPFSRGIGLQTGVHSWNKGNDVMFFCDVDMHFDADFLDRCRFYTNPGKMVYFPIVFSLYNPDTIYTNTPNIKQQLNLQIKTGYWRETGFGMACIYKSDFMNTKGFDTSIKGWGGEDVGLYRKLIKTDIRIIRATDRGLFHIYHPKKCDPSLPQYLSCLTVKVRSEGAHMQMSRLAFGNSVFSNQQPDWKTKLKNINYRQKISELATAVADMKSLKARLDMIESSAKTKNKKNLFGQNNLRELNKSLEGVINTVRKLFLVATNVTNNN